MTLHLGTDIYHILLAFLVGAIIGTEREYRSKSAGLRTMIMVSLASCIFTILSLKIGIANPDRLAANILTGLGFLGAGVIFKDENRVSGITTATTIWMVAALGMALGAGYVLLAVVGTAIVLLVLIFLIYAQDWIERINLSKNYRIVSPFQQKTLQEYEQLFAQYGMRVVRRTQLKTASTITGNWELQGPSQKHEELIALLINDPDILELTF